MGRDWDIRVLGAIESTGRAPRLTLRVVLPPVLGKQRHRPHVPALQQLYRVGLVLS